MLLFLFIFFVNFEVIFLSTTAANNKLVDDPGDKGHNGSIESQNIK